MISVKIGCSQCDHQFDVPLDVHIEGVSTLEDGKYVNIKADVADHDAVARAVEEHYTAARHTALSSYVRFL